MFPTRYFPDRYFAPRYWPKTGENSVEVNFVAIVGIYSMVPTVVASFGQPPDIVGETSAVPSVISSFGEPST